MARAAAPTAAQLRALRELQKPRGGDARQGVMLCPAPATIEEWEAIAVPMQSALMAQCEEDRGGDAPKARDYNGGLADVSSAYKKGARP